MIIKQGEAEIIKIHSEEELFDLIKQNQEISNNADKQKNGNISESKVDSKDQDAN